ncbi:Uma2 family endonuclease [Thermosynechococcaceae cyanobacterium BACA0444]|uniref:Uma2 family endonuclease n=1 Tax=Pseudocalidococcus azoricus BACA0444 TaxID=2918990 RepID=A0AAE4JVQ0_9CYAN|nr:Uma2 family endonuclease [Pseudocalidococcus azoricus]MDS3860565.1 Uma2 family endonuclease [Pseudocalidococcus azoricus BACA0444]
MVTTSLPLLALRDFLNLPETTPASEYIQGQIIQKPMPQGEHSAIQTDLAAAINAVLKVKQIARAFTELRCTFGERSIVPDIAVFRWERIPRNQQGRIANIFTLAPDWTIEILSPDQSQTKVTKNILACLNYGSQMGWLIDPDEQSVFVYQPNQATQVYEQPQAQLPTPLFAPEFNLTVAELFNWLMN